jgi:hypothetical protein
MIKGCLKNVFALVGCVTFLIVGGVVAYQYRAEIASAYRSFMRENPISETTSESPGPTVGYPAEAALRSARQKEALMARDGGPDSVVLTADEMASLIENGLDPVARRALDSLRVTLTEDRFMLQGALETRIFSRDLLGPFAGLLNETEPLEVDGPAEVAGPGVVAWKPDRFKLRIRFPRSLIPPLVDALTRGEGGVVPIAVPNTVRAVRIRSDGVTFFRWTR